MAMHHHGSARAEPGEGFGHGLELIGPRHPQHLGLRPQGIHQRTKLVEHGAHPEAAPQRSQTHQGRVPAGGEHKGDPRLPQGGQHPLRRRRQIHPESLEDISRAHPTAGTAVAVLGHGGTTGGGGEGHGGGNVEALDPGAAGAAGIHQRQRGPGGGHGGGFPQHDRHGRQFRTAHPLGPQGGQQGAGEHRFDGPGQPAVHQRAGLLGL